MLAAHGLRLESVALTLPTAYRYKTAQTYRCGVYKYILVKKGITKELILVLPHLKDQRDDHDQNCQEYQDHADQDNEDQVNEIHLRLFSPSWFLCFFSPIILLRFQLHIARSAGSILRADSSFGSYKMYFLLRWYPYSDKLR